MKKISLLVACLGIISTATFANVHHTLSTPQEGSKVQKAQPVAAPKTQKAEPVVRKAVVKPVETSAPAKTAPVTAKKPVKKVATAKPTITATPAPAEKQKK